MKKALLLCQVEEAQRKHDLLVEIVRKDQEHGRRLVSINTNSEDPFTSGNISYNIALHAPTCRQTSHTCSGLLFFKTQAMRSKLSV